MLLVFFLFDMPKSKSNDLWKSYITVYSTLAGVTTFISFYCCLSVRTFMPVYVFRRMECWRKDTGRRPVSASSTSLLALFSLQSVTLFATE